MGETMMHQILVDNIGCVYRGTSKRKAKQQFDEYVYMSRTGYGRAAHEDVTWLVDDEVYKNHTGELNS
jgi:hypothetical protein